MSMGRIGRRFFESLSKRDPIADVAGMPPVPASWNEFERTKPGGLFTRHYNGGNISGVKLPAEWNEYSATGRGGFVLQHVQQFYTRTFTSASTRQLNFFDAALATEDLFSNTYPYPNSVLWKAIGIYFNISPSLTTGGVAPANQWVSRLDDLMQIVNTGILKIELSKKSWGPFKLWSLNSGGGLWGLLSGGGTPGIVNYANVGMPTVEAAFRLIIPFVIPATSAVKIQMTWPATITLNNGNPDIVLKVEGVEANPVT
jgi:hypothetical protein